MKYQVEFVSILKAVEALVQTPAVNGDTVLQRNTPCHPLVKLSMCAWIYLYSYIFIHVFLYIHIYKYSSIVSNIVYLCIYKYSSIN